jgi:transcriptional regulator with XRE-family HTH domain
MNLKQIFIRNLKEFRKNEGFSQMKLAEYCNTSPSYIGEIEVGRKFPSTEMIEKIAKVLRIEPYHFFVDRTKNNNASRSKDVYPLLPNTMKTGIKDEINSAVTEILSRY